jgi:hypothetical protein
MSLGAGCWVLGAGCWVLGSTGYPLALVAVQGFDGSYERYHTSTCWYRLAALIQSAHTMTTLTRPLNQFIRVSCEPKPEEPSAARRAGGSGNAPPPGTRDYVESTQKKSSLTPSIS